MKSLNYYVKFLSRLFLMNECVKNWVCGYEKKKQSALFE